MKISYKLILGYLLVALLASLTTFTALHSYQNIDTAFVRLVKDPLPTIRILEKLKEAGNRIVSSTSEISVYYSEASHLNDEHAKNKIGNKEDELKEDLRKELAEEERQLTVSGYNHFDNELQRFENLINTSDSSEVRFIEEIRKNGDELKKLSSQLINLKKKGIVGEEILELKEKFEQQEIAYFHVVDIALEHEYEQMSNEQISIRAAIVNSTRTTYLVTFLTFFAAISLGIYISRQIANRIILLKKASESVGRGELETKIKVDATDEIGDLAHSFNKMIDDLKTSRSNLTVAQNFTDQVLNSMVDFVVVVNMDLTISKVNKGALKINGYEEDELIGKSVNMLMGDRPFTEKGIGILREKGFISDLDKLNLNKDGSLTPISMSLSILKDEHGNDLGIVCVGKDISERQTAAEEQARLNNQIDSQRRRLNNIIANVQGIVWETAIGSTNDSKNIDFVSDYVETMLGYSVEEWTSTPNLWLNFVHPEDKERTEREAWAIYNSRQNGTLEFRWITKDNRVIWVESRNTVIFNDEGEPIGLRGVTMDITERKKLEQTLQASEEKYRAFIEKSSEGIWRYEFDEPLPTNLSIDEQIAHAVTHGYLAECNDSMARMYGLNSADELRNTRLSDLFVLSDETNYEYFAGFINSNYCLNDAESHEINNFGEDRYFLNNLVGNFENGCLVSAWGTQRDITERKRAEEKLKIFNQKLQQSNRELQDFAYVASHDLQEPLRKVQAFADRLNTKYAHILEGNGLDYLERMRNAAQRMQTLIQDLLTFSRVTTKAQPFIPVNLKKVAQEVLEDLEVGIEQSKATIEINDLPEIEADPTQMRQLMQNLVGNALKFCRKDVAPIIKIFADVDKVQSNGNGNEHLCKIMVQDNGIGFDEKYLDRIFTVFQRLHGRMNYEGSGIGLAVCRKIVERHHGTITAESSPEKGATFIVTLPFKQSEKELN